VCQKSARVGYQPLKTRACLHACARAQAKGLTSMTSGVKVRVSTRRRHNSASARQQDTEGTTIQRGMASQRQSLPPPCACVHECASRRFDRGGDTSRAAHSTTIRTNRSSGERTWIVGSGTCRRKARLDGRHTSVGGRAVAAVRFNQIKSTSSWARPDFSPRLEGRVPQQGEGDRGLTLRFWT
jgi:hypothetical protein